MEQGSNVYGKDLNSWRKGEGSFCWEEKQDEEFTSDLKTGSMKGLQRKAGRHESRRREKGLPKWS